MRSLLLQCPLEGFELHSLSQANRKVTQPIPDKCSVCQKSNSIEIRRKVVQCVGKVHSVLYRHLTPNVDWKGLCHLRYLCHGIDSPIEILSIVWLRRIGEHIAKLSLAS